RALLVRPVARALADPVAGALAQRGPVHDGRQRVGDRLPEVVVAVNRQGHLPDPADPLADPGDALAPLPGDRVADGVGDVDRLRPRLDRRRQHVAHVVEVRPRRVLGRELDVLAVALRVPYGVDRRLQHFGPGLPELVLQVDVGGRDERVDPRLPRVLHRLPAAVDVRQPHAREPADRRRVLERADLLGDLTRRLEVLVRRDREARLDDVHLEASQLSRHLELLHRVHRAPRRLLAVPPLRCRSVEAITKAATYVPIAIVRRSQAESSTPLSRITADTTSPAAAGVGSPTKNRRSTVPVWTLKRASRRAPQITNRNAPNHAGRPRAESANE